MKRIKLFFLAFLSICLGLTSFSSAFNISTDGISYLNSISLSSGSLSSASLPILYEISSPDSNDIRNLCIVFKNFTRSSDFAWGFRFADSNGTAGNPTPFYVATSPYSLYCVSGRRKYLYINYSSSSNKVSADNYWVFEADNIGFLFSSSDCSQDSNYLQCLEDKNQLIGQVSTLSGSLSSCQSDLSSCRGGQDASLLACINQKEQCESSLITLSGNYASLENMNSSLSSQLQECLEQASGSGDLICNTYDLFWTFDNTNYSYPIKNNLILPPGYKGFVNEGVLAIKPDSSLESAYAIDDDEFQDVIDSFGIVFLYIFGSALFLVFLYMIRKYFIGLKS